MYGRNGSEIASNDVGCASCDAHHRAGQAAEVSHFDCGSRADGFMSRAHWAATKYVRITNAFCNTPTNITYGATPHVKQFFHTGDGANFSLKFNGRRQELSSSSPAVIVPAHTRYNCSASVAHEVIVLRIEEDALNGIAAAMMGSDVQGELELRSPLPKTDAGFRQIQSAVLQMIGDLDSGIAANSFSADALGQALLVRFLMSSSHRFTASLSADVRSPSIDQLRQIEEFIAANWDRDLDIMEIAQTFSIGARSVFRYFRSIRGMTPHEFIRKVRLDAARRMLENPRDGDGVMTIGLRCGFHGMGHFAREYKKMFDELPSQTLRRANTGK